MTKKKEVDKRFYRYCPTCNENGEGPEYSSAYSNGSWARARETPPDSDWDYCADTDRECGSCDGRGTVAESFPDFYVTFVAYCGMKTSEDIFSTAPTEGYEELDARKCAAERIRSLRKLGHDVTILKRGKRWESLEPEGCMLVPDSAGTLELEAFDCEHDMPCNECESAGMVSETCARCSDELRDGGYMERDSGEILCESCADSAGAFVCPAGCDDGLVYISSVTVGAYLDVEGPQQHDYMMGQPVKAYVTKRFPLVAASCSRCGGSPHNPDDTDRTSPTSVMRRDGTYGDAWFVARARMCDSDGIFYSYLCCNEDGEGCLQETFAEQPDVPEEKRLKLETLGPLLGSDDDGLWSEMNDQ